jgi:ankyrin repeat protein
LGTPLSLARNPATVKLFVEANVGLDDIVDTRGNTACHIVASCGCASALSSLIAFGANPFARNDKDVTPLHSAACHPGTIDAVSVLIDAGANPNQEDTLGNTPGHFAASSGQVENLKLLLAHGLRVNRRNNEGETMLLLAAGRGHVDFVRVLIEAGADPTARSTRDSPLEVSLLYAVEIATLLLDAGVWAGGVGNGGLSACHFAARSPKNAVESLRLLIDRGVADVHAVDDDGASVAHGARACVLPLLRSLGVSWNTVDDRGRSLAHNAGETDELMALFALGLPLSHVDKQGRTPYSNCLDFLAGFTFDEQHPIIDDWNTRLLVFAAAGALCDVTTAAPRGDTGAIVIAGGGVVSAGASAKVLSRHEDATLIRLVARQKQIFRLRAFQVCVGLQALDLSALETCEILSFMFAPLASVVPLHFAWEIATTVKHFL